MKDSSKHVASRMSRIQPFRVMQLLARARELENQGRSIVHMEIGEPDFSTPEPVVAAGQRALTEGHTHYTPARGLPALRQAISRHYSERYDVDVDPERILVTPGASGALQLVLSVLIEPGDEVLLSDPGYPCNRNFVHLVGGQPVSVPVDAASDYQLNVERLRDYWTQRTAAVVLASPSNPTGTVLSKPGLEAIAGRAAEHEVHLIVDEIYHGLIYDVDAPTAVAVAEHSFVINSFSKYFGMTGWRLGWVVAPPEYVEELDKLAQNIFLSAPTPAQHAALAAFAPDTRKLLEQRRQAFRQRRDFLIPALRELGFDVPVVPEGAFYIYAGCQRFSNDSFSFCHELLEQAGVAITPGIDFGNYQPETHVRFAYTTSMEQSEEGVRRLRAYLGAY